MRPYWPYWSLWVGHFQRKVCKVYRRTYVWLVQTSLIGERCFWSFYGGFLKSALPLVFAYLLVDWIRTRCAWVVGWFAASYLIFADVAALLFMGFSFGKFQNVQSFDSHETSFDIGGIGYLLSLGILVQPITAKLKDIVSETKLMQFYESEVIYF